MREGTKTETMRMEVKQKLYSKSEKFKGKFL